MNICQAMAELHDPARCGRAMICTISFTCKHFNVNFMVIMAKKTASLLLPGLLRTLAELGDNVRIARKRRGLSAQQVADRAGASRQTIHALEQGAPTVAIGTYAAVLQVLGLEKDIEQVGKADPLGRRLADARIESLQVGERRRRGRRAARGASTKEEPAQ